MMYKETDCSLKLVDEFLTSGYSLVFSKHLMLPSERVIAASFHSLNANQENKLILNFQYLLEKY